MGNKLVKTKVVEMGKENDRPASVVHGRPHAEKGIEYKISHLWKKNNLIISSDKCFEKI